MKEKEEDNDVTYMEEKKMLKRKRGHCLRTKKRERKKRDFELLKKKRKENEFCVKKMK